MKYWWIWIFQKYIMKIMAKNGHIMFGTRIRYYIYKYAQ